MFFPESNVSSRTDMPVDHDDVIRINYVLWIWQVLGWDVLLPLVIFVAPQIAELFLKKHEMNCALYVIFLAIPLFFVRVWVGCTAIHDNFCSVAVRSLQTICLMGVAVWLLMIDSLALSMHDVVPDMWGILCIKGVGLVVSWPFMIFAMYPGREQLRLVTTFRTCERCGTILQTSKTHACR